MAEAVVSIALQTFRDLLIEKSKLLFAVAGEVKALQTQLKEIKCFLEDADRKQHESKIVRNWIAEIRDLAYRSEDVVAEYSVRMSSSSSSDGWGRRVLHRFSGVRHSSSLYQLSSEMLLIKSELARITKAMEGYGINRVIDGAAISGDNQNLARKAFPNFEIGECFVGKEEDLKRLVSLVVDDKEHRAISVWGMGGIGKTTIAKKVYNQIKEAKNSCFDCFVWVCISQQCQIRTVLVDILKQMEGGSVSDLSDVQLNDRLCQIQTNKRCLIVVDDLWQISHWNALKHAFPVLDNLQSKILVTTRKQKVAEIGFSLQLGLLNMDEGLELLQKKAFPHGHIPADFQLDEIGKEMVKKCGYLPLAISLLGGVLSKRKSMAELMLVKENVSAYLFRGDGNIEGENEMHAVLNLSYEDLPYYLKPCFLYLGIFQEDEKIDAYKLYKRWIAQGMVSDEMIRGEETLVDIAELYLGELASRCMIQVEDNCYNISPKYWKCKLHDVVREFCLSAGKKEEFGVEVLEYRDGNFGSLLPAVSRSLNKTRHLAIHFEGEVQLEGGGDLTITTCERLRSLEMLKKWNLKRIQFPPESMIDLEKFKVLRELLIQNFSFEGRKLPRGITKLVHLRYFGLRNCKHLDKLPSSICNLVYLETLDLFGSRILQVPNVFKKVWRFKHLVLPLYNDANTIGDYRLRLEEGVDELESLEWFDSRVHELKSTVRMKNLRSFSGVIYDNKSLLAIMNAITRHWNKLQFCSLWIKGGRLEECEIEDPMLMGILGKLHCLTGLTLSGRSYVGEEMTYPASSFPRLKVLSLYGLEKLKEWRVEQRAMPLLLELYIWQCSNLREWRVEQGAMPLLSKLRISSCPNFWEWRVEQGAMPILLELRIFNCPDLKKVPDEVNSISADEKLDIIKRNLLGNIS
ncbi:hypothetical protein C2S52_018751 [Perilla frutescens var. hirtella]|nr:hypothetical protein C2S52_018751 [Perilla frutescens var. hirtella]